MTRRCAHEPCAEPIPHTADPRTRYCNEAHRKAASRARRAQEGATPRKVHTASQTDAERYTALRAVWDAMAAEISAQGVTVMGTGGVAVAHPLLRFLVQLDSALTAHERTESATPTDPLEAMQAAARKALEAHRSDHAE